MLAPQKESYDKPRQRLEKQYPHFANKGPSTQSYGFFSCSFDRCENWTVKRRLSTKELLLSNCGSGKDS